MNPCCANSHLSVPLRVLALRTSLNTYMCSQVYIYIYSITDTFIYEPILGELTHMFVLLRVPTLWEAVCIHAYDHKHTYDTSLILLYYLCFSNSHICQCRCECSHLEPLCIHTFTYTHKYIYFILQIFLYMNPCCVNSHMSVPLQVPTLRTSRYTCTYSHVYIYHITDTFIYEPMLCELTYMFVPLQVPTLWSSLYTCIDSQIHLCYIINTLVFSN